MVSPLCANLIAIAIMSGVPFGAVQAADVSIANPSVPVQPPPVMSPTAPAPTPAFKPPPPPLAPGEIRFHVEMQESVYGGAGWSSTQNGPRR